MADPFLDDLRARWTDQGIVNPVRATASEIAAYEARHGVRFPPEIVRYFLDLNGTREGRLGEESPLLVSFWHLDQVKPLSEEAPGLSGFAPEVEQRLHVFADHSIWALGWAFACDPSDDAATTPVYVLGGEQAELYADSFEAAFARLLEEGWI